MYYKVGGPCPPKTPLLLRRINIRGTYGLIYAKNKMKDIFEFNHIDKSLSESDIDVLKDFYRHYHKKYWCFKRCYKSYKFLDDVFTISGICLVAIGTITGGITLNPVVLGVVNGAGVIMAGIGKNKNYKKKIELSRIAYTTYEKVLVELRSALRGDEWNKQDFVDRMKLIDEMIIDQTPISDRFAKKYNKKWGGGIAASPSGTPQNPPAARV